MHRAGALLLLALLSAAGCPKPAPAFDYASLPDPRTKPYTVAPGDLVRVGVIGDANVSGTYLVRPDGQISVPLAGELHVAGLTVNAVRLWLVKRLAKQYENASELISVAIAETRGIAYSVIGEVRSPVSFTSRRYLTVLEVLARGGGLTQYAQPDKMYVQRLAGGKPLRIPVSYEATIADPGTRNFFMLSGDILVVP